MQFRVVDIFAGPGGLCEGFSSALRSDGSPAFRTVLSIEKEATAHRTLRLRALFRHLRQGRHLDAYYAYIRDEISTEDLRATDADATAASDREAWCAELGPATHEKVAERVTAALGASDSPWVLIGGPPCQAYSLVGRSRMRGADPVAFESDHRHFLYKEYLRLLANHRPHAFVMENVKGLVSARHSNLPMFDRILTDLKRPGRALGLEASGVEYLLFALSPEMAQQSRLLAEPRDFVIRSEEHGIPQARHRVIVIGIRRDLARTGFRMLPLATHAPVPIEAVTADLPRVRSGLSSGDSPQTWRSVVIDALPLIAEDPHTLPSVADEACNVDVGDLPASRGSRYALGNAAPSYRRDWYVDEQLKGFLHHETRGHIVGDLNRYLFATLYARACGRSPSLRELPDRLLPNHSNVDIALEKGLFNDRFRVQRLSVPSTTITCHISKDGHYFIHPDPTQCRSLTVREAARLQTFPDNYFFEGPRTGQYVQVGNAVPPLLAVQIAHRLRDALDALC